MNDTLSNVKQQSKCESDTIILKNLQTSVNSIQWPSQKTEEKIL